MAAARKGYNVFNKYCRMNIWQDIKDRWWWGIREFLLRDSFGRYVCRIVGHGTTFESEPYDPPVIHYCLRCFQEVKGE